MIYLHPGSSKLLKFNVSDLPTGTTVASARWIMRESPDSADALLDISITPVAGEGGMIANGTGDAVLEFYLGGDGVADLDVEHYYSSCAVVTLSNTESFVLPESIQPVRVRYSP